MRLAAAIHCGQNLRMYWMLDQGKDFDRTTRVNITEPSCLLNNINFFSINIFLCLETFVQWKSVSFWRLEKDERDFKDGGCRVAKV